MLFMPPNILACTEILSLCAETSNSLCAETHLLCAEIYVLRGNLFIVHGNLFTVWKLMCCAEIFSSPCKFFGLCTEIIMSHVDFGLPTILGMPLCRD